MNLLIVEDEAALTRSISTYLVQNNFNCDIATDFFSAKTQALSNDYDCIILDINLPGGSGLELLRRIKQNKKKDGVLIISARNSLDDKVEGLELGADDYLTKPFHLPELSARVNAIIRRKSFNGSNLIELDKITINILDKSVVTENGAIDLTRKEYELLIYFASNQNRILTKEAIIHHLWGDHLVTDSCDFIYSHIKNLRKKLAEAGCPEYIKSIYGLGYKFSML